MKSLKKKTAMVLVTVIMILLCAVPSYAEVPEGAIEGTWLYSVETDTWSFTDNSGKQYVSEWAYVYNPYAQGEQPKASWFFFNKDGIMLTGWRWIRSAIDGNIYCYYMHEISDNCLGMLYTSTIVNGQYEVNADGHWVVDGEQQIRY